MKYLARLAFLVFLLAPMLASAQYPEKPIRMILPYSSGGGADVIGRPLAMELTKILGKSVFAENRGGASGNIAMEYVANSAPDGYTIILMLTAQAAVNNTLFKDSKIDAIKDFEPISLIAKAPYFLAINPSVPAKNIQEFITLIRNNPGKYSYASTGNGSGTHLSMVLLKSISQLDILHVAYKGGGGAYTDLLSGQVDASFVGAGSAKGFIQNGQIRLLAVTTPQRSPIYPEVPTLAESGVTGYSSEVWYALFAPKGTPPAIIKKLNSAVLVALKSPQLKERYVADSIQTIGSTPEELTAFTKTERVKWAQMVGRLSSANE
jgi:tripartite-type tricarboxylate transporter receptor subunit TctC